MTSSCHVQRDEQKQMSAIYHPYHCDAQVGEINLSQNGVPAFVRKASKAMSESPHSTTGLHFISQVCSSLKAIHHVWFTCVRRII
jgi:hypothetical protein